MPVDELAGDQVRQKRGARVALGQDRAPGTGDVHALVAVPAAPLRAHVPLHPHLAAARSDSVRSASSPMRSIAQHTPSCSQCFCSFGRSCTISLRGRCAGIASRPPAVALTLVGGDLRGARRVRRIRRFDRGEHLRLVEEQLLLERTSARELFCEERPKNCSLYQRTSSSSSIKRSARRSFRPRGRGASHSVAVGAGAARPRASVSRRALHSLPGDQ